MQLIAMSSACGTALRCMLRVGSVAFPISKYACFSPPAAVKAAAWSTRYAGASALAFSTTNESHANALSRSLLSDIQALQLVHDQLSMPGSSLSQRFGATLECIERCLLKERCVFVTGIGKSGIVARRLAATLASISVRSQWVHGSEWTHGDVGNLQPGDVVILLSHSGTTAELLSLPTLVANRQAESIAIVGQEASALADMCSLTLVVPVEDPPHCPVPSRSIVVQEAICNAIVENFLDKVGSRSDAFRSNHPGGAIGDEFANS